MPSDPISKIQTKLLIGALIGLGRAAEGNKDRPTDATDQSLIIGIKMLTSDTNFTDEEVAGHIETLHQEKYKMASRCLTCKKKCGRNDDFDLVTSSELDDNTSASKYVLLSVILAIGSRLSRFPYSAELQQETAAFLYDALFMVGSARSSEQHWSCIEQAGIIFSKLMLTDIV